jgi:hypothetical protein
MVEDARRAEEVFEVGEDPPFPLAIGVGEVHDVSPPPLVIEGSLIFGGQEMERQRVFDLGGDECHLLEAIAGLSPFPTPQPPPQLLSNLVLCKTFHPPHPVNLQEVLHRPPDPPPSSPLESLLRFIECATRIPHGSPRRIGWVVFVELLQPVEHPFRHDVSGLVRRAEGETDLKKEGEEGEGDTPYIELGSVIADHAWRVVQGVHNLGALNGSVDLSAAM